MPTNKYLLHIIVLSQFLCTSLWFAGNGVMTNLISEFDLSNHALGYLTSAVQFGFIGGTLIFGFLSLSDRYSPSKVFFICSILGSLFNLGIIHPDNSYLTILACRFITGFFLAGIYPVGMKIASDYYHNGLGKSLGYLVGALVIGTAFPHLLSEIKGDLPWEFVIVMTSLLAVLGGVLMITLVSDGPYCKPYKDSDLTAIPRLFKNKKFKSASIGYFGHMWELYTFWTFVPVMLQLYSEQHLTYNFNIPVLTFMVIGIGGVACVIGGHLAEKHGVKNIAVCALMLSCVCCIASPLVFTSDSQFLFIAFLLFWGMVVIADSPLFSTLVAQNAPLELKGTGLTIVTSVGFFLTIVSIQCIDILRTFIDHSMIFMLLGIGPLIGLIVLRSSTESS